MAAMVAARRVLRRSLPSSRCALRLLASSPISVFSRLSRLPAELDCAQSLICLRTINTSALERIDGEFYQDSKSHKGEIVEDCGRTSNGHHGYTGAENIQPHNYQGGFYRQKYAGFQQNPNGNYGYSSGQPYQSLQVYNSVNRGDNPNNQQVFDGNKTSNGHYGYNPEQPPQSPNGFEKLNTRGEIPINQQVLLSGERYTNGHYKYNSGQLNQSSIVYNRKDSKEDLPDNRQFFNGDKLADIHSRHGSFHQEKAAELPHSNRAGFHTADSGQPYQSPGEFYKANAAGFQQAPNGHYGYNPGQAYENPDMHNRVDLRGHIPNIQQQFPGESTTNIHPRPGGFYQENPTEFQHSNLGGQRQHNNISFQSGIAYPQTMENNTVNEGLSSRESSECVEASHRKGTIGELDEYCREGKVKEAVEVLALLEENGVVVDIPRYFQLMQACADASSVEQARAIHEHISQTMVNIEVGVHNKILDMYTKCGLMDDAKKLFESMPKRNLTSWDTMIRGLANNGLGEEAIELFSQFKQMGLRPDSGMFVNVFFACGVVGAVDEGMLHFESMQKDFSITPSMEHYMGIVDMLGQSSYLDEALEFIEQMPIEPSVDIWESLMNLCRVNGYLELGDRCAEIVEQLDSSRLNEQAKAGLLPVKEKELAKEKERKKANLLEVRNRVHEYRAGDRSHPEHEKIYEQLRYLSAQMKEAGYIPDTRFVLHDVDQESKEEALLAHSERLAVGYGLLTSAARSPIRIIKNLRCCGDCHNALKIISKLVGRQLIARDAKRFHHFENGVCSCKDYW
ncbi:pentatricopeptide repeat-containing protein At4g32450, mitochondrial-like [Typha latifolia]|uniref:pentatricopeptide repeat-containing protein At4g32450, mitochondrial-like n=1 Tax=Typha latifolia TaxID=4733 RepID=UPI003C2B0343